MKCPTSTMKLSTTVSSCMCKRLKSSTSFDKGKEAILRLRRENRLLFGKLLESSTAKRKRLEKSSSKHVDFNGDSTEDLLNANKKSMEVVPPFCAENEVRPPKSVNDEVSTVQSAASSSNRVPSHHPVSAGGDDAENSLFSFPLLNLKKDKYVVDGNSEEKLIGKLSSYHPDCKSVSEILSNSMSSQSEANLERWKANMVSKLGADEFKSFNKNQMSQGSMFRTKILNYLNGVPESELKIGEELKRYWTSAKTVFPVIQQQGVVDTGGLVVHPHLKYKGAFDCLAVFRNEVMLVSWKKSDKYVPSLERTYDIPLQIAAYMGALNFDDRYPFRVEQALLVMAYGDGSKADLFHLNEEKCEYYWKQWLERLDTYLKRVQVEDQHRKEEKNFERCSVPNIEKATPDKIDVDNEIEKMAGADQQHFPRILKESKENESRTDSPLLLHPLSNPEKPDYDPALNCRIQPSLEYENAYPSVSSVLSDSKSETAKYILEKWRQMMIAKLGLEGFQKYERETLEAGTALHEYLRQRFSSELSSDEPEIPSNIEGFWKSLTDVLPLVDNVQVTESKVAHPVCKYRGIIDCIGFFQNKLVVIDWKTSEKMKTSVSMTYDAPLQIAAYIGALNFDPSYPFKVEEGLIVVAYSDGTKANVFHLDKEKCLKYWRRWLERVDKYQRMAYENGTKIQY